LGWKLSKEKIPRRRNYWNNKLNTLLFVNYNNIMITKTIDENLISVIPEDSEDLLNLRRIIKENDKVIGDTTRVLKQDKEYARPDKGERIKIRIALTVEKISLDEVLDKLRIGGIISESSNESVPHGSHHSFILQLNDGITISKKKWLPIEKKLVEIK